MRCRSNQHVNRASFNISKVVQSYMYNNTKIEHFLIFHKQKKHCWIIWYVNIEEISRYLLSYTTSLLFINNTNIFSFNFQQDTLWFFNDQLCRAMPLIFDQEFASQGVPCYRWCLYLLYDYAYYCSVRRISIGNPNKLKISPLLFRPNNQVWNLSLLNWIWIGYI